MSMIRSWHGIKSGLVMDVSNVSIISIISNLIAMQIIDDASFSSS